MLIRELRREEVESVWTIDRSEIVENIYTLEQGKLIRQADYCDIPGWPPGEAGLYTPILLDCFERGGSFYGAFAGEKLVGVAILESKFIGRQKDQLQLKFLHVSRAFRRHGLGRTLFEKAATRAKSLGASKLYISATPSENTINFYLSLGCVVAETVDPTLFALEPEDIHLEYTIYQEAENQERQSLL
jgi:predicted N-acetyltransferase YhbS